MMARAWEHNMVPFNNREDIRCWIDARARPARRFYRRCVQQGDPIRTPRLRSRGAAAQERAEIRSAQRRIKELIGEDSMRTTPGWGVRSCTPGANTLPIACIGADGGLARAQSARSPG